MRDCCRAPTSLIDAHDSEFAVRRQSTSSRVWKRWFARSCSAAVAVAVATLLVAQLREQRVISPSAGPRGCSASARQFTNAACRKHGKRLRHAGIFAPSSSNPGAAIRKMPWPPIPLAPPVREGSAPLQSPEWIAAGATPVERLNSALHRHWQQQQVTVPAMASDEEWVRRVWVDLAGHVPTPADVEQFLSDKSLAKREALVDSLLASRSTARNFATLWTNLLVGREEPQTGSRTALLTELTRRFDRNLPWSETVVALIAADGNAKEVPAASFLLAHCRQPGSARRGSDEPGLTRSASRLRSLPQPSFQCLASAGFLGV